MHPLADVLADPRMTARLLAEARQQRLGVHDEQAIRFVGVNARAEPALDVHRRRRQHFGGIGQLRGNLVGQRFEGSGLRPVRFAIFAGAFDLRHFFWRERRVGAGAGFPGSLQHARLRRLHGNHEDFFAVGVFLDATTGASDSFAGEFLAHLIDLRQRVVGKAEFAAEVELFGETRRDFRRTQGGEEHTAGVGGIAVAVLAATAGDDHRLVGITLAVEQAHQDIGAVEFDVNAAVAFAARLARQPVAVARILVILLLNELPGFGPVGVFLRPSEKVADHLGVLAVGWDAPEAGFDQVPWIGLEIRLGIHAADELAGVKAVAIVHQPAELFAERDGHIRQPGRDDAGEVGFDLVVNVVAVRRKLRMTAVGRGDAFAEVLPAGLVGAPKRIAAVGEVNARLPDGGIEAVLFERPQERHLDVTVVIVVLVDHLRFPRRHLVFGDDFALDLELGGLPPTDADHLAEPRAFHLVANSFTDRRRYSVGSAPRTFTVISVSNRPNQT